MLYQREDGSASMIIDNHTIVTEAAILKIQESIKMIDEYYEHVTPDQVNRLRAMTSHLMTMITDEGE